MRKRDIILPAQLRNGVNLPSSILEIVKDSNTYPKYKIVVYSTDTFCSSYRIVHSYYIFLIGDDPSFVQKLMKSRNKTPGSGFEDGRLVPNLLLYTERMRMSSMPFFRETLQEIVRNNSEKYILRAFHNIVMASTNLFGSGIVYFSEDEV